jgi:CheY-like chemotaxis protein
MSSHSSPWSEAGASESSARRQVVLIADDYPENRRLMYYYLRDDYEVVQVETAEAALEFIDAHPGQVNLVVMDLNFKDGMSGIEAMQAIRQRPHGVDLPVLALTAYAYPDDRRRCIEAGFDDYLSKPVFKQAMLDKVRQMILARTFGNLNGDGARSGDGVRTTATLRSGDGVPQAEPSIWITRGKR